MKPSIFNVLIVSLICSLAFGEQSPENYKPQKRHPNHKMEVSYVPQKKVFKLGDPIEVTLIIKNVGENTFSFTRGGRQRGARDNQFAFTAQAGGKMLPDIGDPNNTGGKGFFIILNPGEDVKIPVTLDNWFNFNQEGVVYLRGSYYMALRDPTYKEYSFIWEDFACAEFTVTVKNTIELDR